MSLQICPHCNHCNSWGHIYFSMNMKHTCSAEIAMCQKCHKMMVRSASPTTFFEKLFHGFLWLFPAILLVCLVIGKVIDFRYAIALVIMYHIVSFLGIIYFYNYTKEKT